MKVDISIGELFDKITILKIKVHNGITEAQKELDILERISDKFYHGVIPPLVSTLYEINAQCWEIEDRKRQHERDKDFGEDFIQLARSVYIMNDLRAHVKKQINELSNSEIMEYKKHA